MKNHPNGTPDIGSERWRGGYALGLLLGCHTLACCWSLVFAAEYYEKIQIVMFDKAHLYEAALVVAIFTTASIAFIFARFSFGYILGFYFYTMILCYLWIVEFSRFHYDHGLASISAFVSALAFLTPVLFFGSPLRQRLVLSPRALERLLSLIPFLAAAVVVAGAFYNFRLVSLADIYDFRAEIAFPWWLKYAIGVTSNALLPFAFACFAVRGSPGRATAVLLLMLLFYPITLTKLALFAPVWLLFLALLSRLFEARAAVILSLFLPLLAGVLAVGLVKAGVIRYAQIAEYFGAINFRMIAFPSVALDVYSDFFASHDRTWFCQIQLLKPFMSCPYNEYLSVIMSKTYGLGNLNASLFATEGIASVGPILAPLSALGCGLVIALANRASAGLPPQFVLLSGGILPQVFLNVPLTTTLLSNGAALLFLLWYVTPRGVFGAGTSGPSAAAAE